MTREPSENALDDISERPRDHPIYNSDFTFIDHTKALVAEMTADSDSKRELRAKRRLRPENYPFPDHR
jgi:hypothetical protein